MNSFFSQYFIYIVGFLIVVAAQSRVQSAYHKYKNISNKKKVTGHDAARAILDANDLHNVRIEMMKGSTLSDHYDPRHHIVRLSEDIYYRASIASLCIAAHEVGHAIQHKEHYGAIALRNRILPAAQFASRLGWIVLFIGFFLFSSTPVILYIGIILICVILLFQVVTLPIEFNASHRAIQQLEALHMVSAEEVPMAKAMLKAAAFTYVAAVLATLTQILRILLIVLNSRRSDR